MLGQKFQSRLLPTWFKRDRFKRVGRALDLPIECHQRNAPLDGPLNVLDLGGLRARGAIDWLRVTEGEAFCVRQGGWGNRELMNIYLQEFTAVSLLSTLPARTQRQIVSVARYIPFFTNAAVVLLREGIPATHWTKIFKHIFDPPLTPLT